MSLNHVETFKQSLVPKDHEEALAINAKYDQLAKQGIAKATLLQQAKAATDEALALQVPNGEQFGFDVVNKALRWWHFRQACLDDLEPIYQSLDETGDPEQHGLDPIYTSYMDKLAKYEEDQAFSGRCILHGDPFYIDTYAQAEKERLRREVEGEELFDPFKVEYHHALRTLRKTLDTILDSTAATGPPHKRQYLSDSKSQVDNYLILRAVEAEQITYTISQFNDEPEHRLITVQPSESIPLATYTLNCHRQSIILAGESIWHEPRFDSLQALTLAANISTSQE